MPEDKKRDTPILSPVRFQSAEHGRQEWLATAESSDHPEDFTKPEFWANVAARMRPLDHVEVRTDDGAFWGEYLVVACDRQWAQLHALREVRLAQAIKQPTDKRFRVEWKGPHLKHCVIRTQDNSILHEGAQQAAEASRWLEDYLRTIGKKAA